MKMHVKTTLCELKLLLEGRECCKDIQMKVYDIMKLTS